jgi:hypothetical protein
MKPTGEEVREFVAVLVERAQSVKLRVAEIHSGDTTFGRDCREGGIGVEEYQEQN